MQFNYFARDNTIPLFIQFGIHESYMFPHVHADFYELVLVMEGSAEHIVGDERFPLRKGDLFVIPSGGFHAYENARNLHVCNVMFKHEMLTRYEKSMKRTEGYKELFHPKADELFRAVISLSPKDFAVMSELVRGLEREYSGDKAGRDILIYSYFSQLVVTISRLYGLPVKKREISAVTAAASYLEEHYMEEYPLKQAMELSNYSRRHFCRLFMEVYGLTPQDYLLDVRMRNAEKLLRDTEISVAETAIKCGFSDSGYFSRVFKKHFGVLPSHYRAGKG